MTDERQLSIRYVPLADATRWDRNPKKHDIPSIQESIRKYGFRDPPEYDGTLKALVAGNGRTTSLMKMKEAGEPAPRYIHVLENGDWAVPIVFGADADSKRAAEQYAVDHNLLTLGHPSLTREDVQLLYDEAQLLEVLDIPPDGDPVEALLSQSVLISDSVLGAIRSGFTGAEAGKSINDIQLEFEEQLAEGFAHAKAFGTRVQLVADLTEGQANNEQFKTELNRLRDEYGLKFRIKQAR